MTGPIVHATRFGRPLPEGGTVGVPAPSGPYVNRSDVLRGVEWWEERGYRVKLADGIWDQDDYVAGDPKSRARDLMAMFADPEVDVIQCLWGGTGAAQMLPFIDFDVIAAHPKAFVGFSDITALHVPVRQLSGLATFHGPGLGSMGSPEREAFTWDSLVSALSGDGGIGEVPRDPKDPYVRAIAPGRVTAPLVGGNLWTMQHLMGTPWEPTFDGAILLFEDVDLPPYQMEGMLNQLRLAGKLEGVVGVVVGEMVRCEGKVEEGTPRTRTVEDVLELYLEPLGVPVLYKLPLGHGKHLATVPLGVTATLDADERRLTIDQPSLMEGS